MQGVVYSNPSDRDYQEAVAELGKKYLDLQPHHLLVDLAGKPSQVPQPGSPTYLTLDI